MKYAMVTGASSGLGRALAIQLSHAKYALALVGRNTAELKKTWASLAKESHGESFVMKVDLANPREVETLLASCQAKWGQETVDLLINCAGYGVSGRLQDIPHKEFERCWRVNYWAPVSLIQQVLPRMIQRRQGTIVNVTSGVASRALPFISPYASAKAALNSVTESLRVELAGTGVRILLFSPGPVASNFQKAKQHFGSTKLKFPPFRGESPEKVARALFRAIGRKESRVMLGMKAVLARHLNYWSPEITDKLVEKLYRLDPLNSEI